MKKSRASRALKKLQLLISPFVQLEQSNAPGVRDLTDLTFNPMRLIKPTKCATFHVGCKQREA